MHLLAVKCILSLLSGTGRGSTTAGHVTGERRRSDGGPEQLQSRLDFNYLLMRTPQNKGEIEVT